MTESTKPKRDKVNELLDTLEERGWLVHNYDADVEPVMPLTVTVELEYQPQADVEQFNTEGDPSVVPDSVLELIKDLEIQYDNGVPMDEIVNAATDRYDCEREDVIYAVNALGQKGELYEYPNGHYNAT